MTLAADDLRELWRREAIKPSPIFSRPSLGMTAAGRTLLLVAEDDVQMVSFDAATGTPGPVLEISSGGSGVLRFLPEVLLAPRGRPRSEDQPADWEEPFASYMKLLDPANR